MSFAYKNEGADSQVAKKDEKEVDAVPSGETPKPNKTNQKHIQPGFQAQAGYQAQLGVIMHSFAFVLVRDSGDEYT